MHHVLGGHERECFVCLREALISALPSFLWEMSSFSEAAKAAVQAKYSYLTHRIRGHYVMWH